MATVLRLIVLSALLLAVFVVWQLSSLPVTDLSVTGHSVTGLPAPAKAGLSRRMSIDGETSVSAGRLLPLPTRAADLPLPVPLDRRHRSVETGTLTVSGVLSWTNRQRSAEGIHPLALDSQLSAAAERKLRDMFDREYFAHVSPIGVEPQHLVAEAGYNALLSGENLALGGFADDKELVQAWMDSPGHRANIMRRGFTEIGLAVGSGLYQGRTVWLAVQTFGTPAELCPAPDASLKEDIERNAEALRDGLRFLEGQRATLERMPPHDRTLPYRIREFNSLNNERNQLVTLNNSLIDRYNAEVEGFRECLKSLR